MEFAPLQKIFDKIEETKAKLFKGNPFEKVSVESDPAPEEEVSSRKKKSR